MSASFKRAMEVLTRWDEAEKLIKPFLKELVVTAELVENQRFTAEVSPRVLEAFLFLRKQRRYRFWEFRVLCATPQHSWTVGYRLDVYWPSRFSADLVPADRS